MLAGTHILNITGNELYNSHWFKDQLIEFEKTTGVTEEYAQLTNCYLDYCDFLNPQFLPEAIKIWQVMYLKL